MTRPGLWRLILKNLGRRPFRSAALALGVAVVAGLQISAALLDRTSEQGLERGLQRMGADLVAVPSGLDRDLLDSYLTGQVSLFYMDRSVRDRIAGYNFVKKTSAQVYLQSLARASCCSASNIFLVGFEPDSDFTVQAWLARHPGKPIGPDQVLAGAGLGVEPGATLKFYGHDFQVAGVLDPTGMGIDLTVFIPMPTAYLMARESGALAEQTLELKPEKISAVMIKLKPESEGGLPGYRAAYELEKAIPEVSIIQPDDLSARARNNLSGTLKTLRSASYAVWPLAALMIGLLFSMSVSERQREIGILRALGATRWFVFILIIGEALLLTGLGAATGIVTSVSILAGYSKLIAASLQVPFLWPSVQELIGLSSLAMLMALLTGAGAALIPASQSSRKDPYQAIRGGES